MSDSLPTFSTDNLATINEAISSGALKVKYADKEVMYQTADDLIKIRNLMLIALSPDRPSKGGRVRMRYRSGL